MVDDLNVGPLGDPRRQKSPSAGMFVSPFLETEAERAAAIDALDEGERLDERMLLQGRDATIGAAGIRAADGAETRSVSNRDAAVIDGGLEGTIDESGQSHLVGARTRVRRGDQIGGGSGTSDVRGRYRRGA